MRHLLLSSLLVLAGTTTLYADATFNGHGEYQTDAYGYYYVFTGGLFPNGQTVNGTKTSGGSMARTFDDPSWASPSYTMNTWLKDGWFAQTAGVALTMKNNGSIVFDNNGLENNSYPGEGNPTNFYMYNLGDAYQGLYRGYAMSNNFDHIYAGYFKLAVETTINEIIGYFDPNGNSSDVYPFDPDSPFIGYRMNIWSNVDVNKGSYTEKRPLLTNSFVGDQFTTDGVSGTFSTSDTGVDRGIIGQWTEDIYRLTFKLDTPISLPAGEYWFSHDATIIPEPASLLVWSVLGLVGGAYGLRRLRRVVTSGSRAS